VPGAVGQGDRKENDEDQIRPEYSSICVVKSSG
jgi:hypothetical protein